jgi:hypothetical protein
MSKQTAVEWLEKLQLMKFPRVREAFLDAFNQAKKMEKEQIQKAFDDSVWRFDDDISSEQYYKETYGGDHE